MKKKTKKTIEAMLDSIALNARRAGYNEAKAEGVEDLRETIKKVDDRALGAFGRLQERSALNSSRHEKALNELKKEFEDLKEKLAALQGHVAELEERTSHYKLTSIDLLSKRIDELEKFSAEQGKQLTELFAEAGKMVTPDPEPAPEMTEAELVDMVLSDPAPVSTEEPQSEDAPPEKTVSMPVWDESAGLYVVNNTGHIGRDLWKKQDYYAWFTDEIRRLIKDGKSPRYIADRLKVRERSVLERIQEAKIEVE